MNMKTMFMALVVFVAGVAALAQGSSTSNGREIAGTWEVTVKGPAAHGDLSATLDLQQQGKKVTGTFVAHGNTHNVAGEFDNGELAVETTETVHDKVISLTGRLKDDGTMAGYLSSAMGDMQWTASRVKTQK